MSETKVITGLVRFSYAQVFEPRAGQDGGTPKYSVSILIPKSNKQTIQDVKAAIEAAVVLGASKFNNKDPKKIKNFHWALRDGDEEKEDDENYADMMFVNAKSNSKPTILDREKNQIFDTDDFYSGCWGRAAINFYPFEFSGKKGIACGLNNIQKLKEGDSLSGGSSAQVDFADDLEDDDLLD